MAWFGTRGTDSASLLAFPEFYATFSQTAPLSAVSVPGEWCLETMTGRRVDLDTYDIDEDTSTAARELRRQLLEVLRTPAVVVPYRPSRLLSSACFLAADTVEYLGQFIDAQVALEHKPWVESELRRAGVPVVEWTYYTPDDLSRLRDRLDLARTPLVVRRNRSAGGVGFGVAHNRDELALNVAEVEGEEFVAAAPYLHPNLPLNVGACVFADGTTTVHGASVQLIGVPGCTTRPFGYCGNDFGTIRDLGRGELEELDGITRRVGAWMAARGYRGAFGIDALAHDGRIVLMEVNPRFQGSSALAATLAYDAGLPDLFLEHMAAYLGLPPGPALSLREWVAEQPCKAQVICHNLARAPEPVAAAYAPDGARCAMLPAPGVEVDPDAVLCKLVVDGRATDDGFTLCPAVDQAVRRAVDSLCVLRPESADIPPAAERELVPA
ncbi:MAG TPA: ATP-grasp domain-containing protein [Longimicrobium sp.]|nr:ATP-grasp domain-containing protein [Longimicrobium sp.]